MNTDKPSLENLNLRDLANKFQGGGVNEGVSYQNHLALLCKHGPIVFTS